MSKINMFKTYVWTFGENYKVAILTTLYLTVSGIIIIRLKSIEQSQKSFPYKNKDDDIHKYRSSLKLEEKYMVKLKVNCKRK